MKHPTVTVNVTIKQDGEDGGWFELVGTGNRPKDGNTTVTVECWYMNLNHMTTHVYEAITNAMQAWYKNGDK